MKKEDIIANLEYLIERARNPTYDELEVGFRHTPLRPKEIEMRKDDCLSEIADSLSWLIREINKND